MIRRLFIGAVLLAVLAAAPAGGQSLPMVGPGMVASGGGGGLNGFTAKKTVTIDHTKVGSSTHTDFPMLFSGTYAYLKTTGNGGDVTSSSGFDILFYPNSDCSGTMIAPEIDSYSASTGAVSLWVNIASLSNSSDTVIYLCYGKSSITTQQGTPSNNWNSGFLGVWHAGDGSTLSLADSTSNARTLTNTNTTAASGKVSGAFSLNGSSKWLKNTAFVPPASITIAFWQNANSSVPNEPYVIIIGDRTNDTGGTSNRILTHAPYQDNTLYWDFGNATAAQGRVSTAYGSYLSAWAHVVLTYDNGSGDHKIYLNGSQAASSNYTISHTLGNGLYIGHCDLTTGGGKDGCEVVNYAYADVDELQISNLARSADWILAQYNNQNSPATFYTLT